MIHLLVNVSGTASMSPVDWDTACGAQVTLTEAVRKALANYCSDIDVSVELSLDSQ